jgi:uncharacterized protein
MDDLLDDVARGDLASVQARIRADPSLLNARGGISQITALECAADYSHLHIARYMVGEGAQVNEGDGTGSSVLRVACICMRANHQAVVELLLEAGADAVTPDEGGKTVLMTAADRGHLGITRSLLAHGCGDIDARDGDGRTAIWWACYWNRDAGVALLLLEAGADMSIASRWGMTPLDVARELGYHDCVAVLEVSTHTGPEE